MIVTVTEQTGRTLGGRPMVSPVRNVHVDDEFVGHLYRCGSVIIINALPLPLDDPIEQLTTQLEAIDGHAQRSVQYAEGLKAYEEESSDDSDHQTADSGLWFPDNFEY